MNILAKKSLLISIVISEIIFFSIVGFYFYNQKRKLSALPQKVAVPKEIFQQNKDDKFDYFYELATSSDQVNEISWLKNPVTYHFNQDGLNERQDYEKGQHQRVYRIIVLGDSFAFGLFVNTEENFSEKLEDLLNKRLNCQNFDKFEVINFGVPGYDLRYTAKRFLDKAVVYEPDLVMWFLRDDDFFLDNELFKKRELFYEEELKASESAKKYNVDPKDDFPQTSLAYKEFIEKFNNYSSSEKQNYIANEAIYFDEVLKIYAGPFLIFTNPETSDEYKSVIRDLSKKAKNSYFIENINKFETYEPNDYHPSPKGHSQLAEELYSYLKNNNVINCNQL